MSRVRLTSPFALAAIVLLVLAAWLIVSDVLIEAILPEGLATPIILVADLLFVAIALVGLFILARGMVRDAAVRAADAEARQRDLELQVTANDVLQRADTEPELNAAFVRALVARGVAGAGVLTGLPDGSIRVVAAGGAVAYFEGLEVRWDSADPRGQGPIGTAYRERRTVLVEDNESDASVAFWLERQRSSGFRSMVALPLLTEETIVGVLAIYFSVPRPLTVTERRTLELVAGDLARGTLAIRRRADAAASAERIRSALAASPSPILLIGPDATVVYANDVAAKTFGYSIDDFVGLTLAELVPSDVVAEHRHRVDTFLASQSARTMGERHGLSARRRDGSVFPADISLGPVAIDGAPHVVCTVLDLTTQRELEARLLQAMKMESMGQFANILAHDFRNYLAAISGFAELALVDSDDPAALADDLSHIRGSVDRATALIRDVLTFARPMTDEPSRAEIVETMAAMRPLLEQLVGATIVVELETGPDIPPAAIAPSLLGHVLMNLASNARDAMPDGGRLTIGASSTDASTVVVTVRDSGTGMTPEVAARLFDAFFSTKGEASGERSGTGLGLTSARFIVERAGGRIDVESTSGAGSTFRLELPVVPAPSSDRRPVA